MLEKSSHNKKRRNDIMLFLNDFWLPR